MPTTEDLGRRVKQVYPGAYDSIPDGRLGQMIQQRFPGKYTQFTDSIGTSPSLAMTPQYNPVSNIATGLGARALETLPSIGGFVGGLAGTPGGVPGMIGGAAAGGALGEGAREYLRGQPFSPTSIGLRGAGEGALQAGGIGLSMGARALAPKLMRKALGTVPSLAKRFKTTQIEIAKKVLEMRLPASMVGEQAAVGIGSVARAERAARIGGITGTVGANRLARTVIGDAEKAIGRGLTSAERRALILQVQDEANSILGARTHGVVAKGPLGTPAQPASKILNQYGSPAIAARAAKPPPPSRYTMREVEQIKEVAAKRAKPAYRAEQEAASVAADPAFYKQLASGARRTVNRIPGIAEHNARIKDAMMAQQSISGALTRSGEWTPLHVGPISLGMKIPPEKIGGLALWLSSPNFQRYARQSPRAAAALISQMMYYDEPDATRP